ncbi:reverse transcriptase domain-containing protein [Tanacetum coccineum]
MPKGAKVLKDLLSHKEKLEKAASSVKLSKECSAIIQRSLPQKEGDPRSFTLPCLIGTLAIKNALADLGARQTLENQLKPLRVEPPELELKELPEHLECAFLQENNKLSVVISSVLSTVKKARHLELLRPLPQEPRKDAEKAPIMIKPDWSLPFKVMCDASDYAVRALLGQRIDKHFKLIHYANHSALRYLFTKQDTKPRLIRWILLLQEFNIEIRDKKGAENLAFDHLSRLENPNLGKLTKAEIREFFPEERLMAVSDKSNKPRYVDYANYLASRVLPFRSTRQEKQKFFNDLRHYFLDEPFLFKQCADRIIQRCIARDEAAQILRQCHSGPSGEHHGIATTARKVFKARFYKLSIFRDAHRKEWSHKLDDALWAFRTAFKTRLGTTPFRIIYDKACHLPVKLEHKAYRAIKNSNMDLMKAGANRLFPGKLKSRWCEPFLVSKDMKNGAVELYDEDGNEFIVNKQWLKPYQKDVLEADKNDDITLDDEGEVTKFFKENSLRGWRQRQDLS